MYIDFENVNHRKDYLSVDKLTAISAEGELFEVGNLVETDDPKLGTATITHFTLDEESCDVRAYTEKGWNRICFLTVLKSNNTEAVKSVTNCPTCGSEVMVEGTTTHHYVPIRNPKFKYVGECKGNNDEGCFMDSPGHACGCFTREIITNTISAGQNIIEAFYTIDELYKNVAANIAVLLSEDEIQKDRPIARLLESFKNEFVVKSNNFNSVMSPRLIYMVDTIKHVISKAKWNTK